MLINKSASLLIIMTGCFMFLTSICNGAGNKSYKYNFSGWDSNHGRRTTISFNLTDDGHISGKQDIKPLCEKNIKLAGAQLTFTGYLTASYPQAAGSFKGFTIFCGGKKSPINGTIKIGFHPSYGVFTQLFSSYSGEEYYFKGAKNPFN